MYINGSSCFLVWVLVRLSCGERLKIVLYRRDAICLSNTVVCETTCIARSFVLRNRVVSIYTGYPICNLPIQFHIELALCIRSIVLYYGWYEIQEMGVSLFVPFWDYSYILAVTLIVHFCFLLVNGTIYVLGRWHYVLLTLQRRSRWWGRVSWGHYGLVPVTIATRSSGIGSPG